MLGSTIEHTSRDSTPCACPLRTAVRRLHSRVPLNLRAMNIFFYMTALLWAGAASCDTSRCRLGKPGFCIAAPTSPIMSDSAWALCCWCLWRELLRYAHP